ncbi:MAG TPA: hypothetical protein VI854_01135 [Acidimicrobiia bacterium]|nr:hypothetical protein [Acidimicrobiia bacterium]
MTAVIPAPTNDPLLVDGSEAYRHRVDAAKGSALLGLALALVHDGASSAEAVGELWVEAADNRRALESAYGRGVALVNDYPGDPDVRQAVVLVSKALRHGARCSAATGEA